MRSDGAPKANALWVAAQLGLGSQAIGALKVGRQFAPQRTGDPDAFKAPWPSSDIGVVYAGVAGLLNLLIILDVLARVETRQAAWQSDYQAEREAGRTGEAFGAWREGMLTQAAVAWLLGCVFVRFMEDNGLVDEALLSGPHERRQQAADQGFFCVQGQQIIQPITGHLDARGETLAAHPHPGEASGQQPGFRLADPLQPLSADALAIGESGGQTGLGRLVPPGNTDG